MVKATVDGVVVAESEQTVVVEGNHYFPPEAVKWEHFTENTNHTVCPWKGVASYYDVRANGKQLESAAWTYPEPSRAATRIGKYVAFYKHMVKIEQG
ncbi:MAG: DUF427 domain-containing protein [SAR202 cluster bacterium]|nr:DUF427 domain-containing protein [SAR202 cluster bacterium]